MILQKLTPHADAELLASAMRQKVELPRTSFAVIRKTGSTEHFVLRGRGANGFAPVGAQVTFKEDPDTYRGPKPPVSGEVVSVGRSRHLMALAIPSIVAMLAGTTAVATGAQIAAAGNLYAGLSVVVSGVIAVGHYVYQAGKGQVFNDFAGKYIDTAIDHSDLLQVASVEVHVDGRVRTAPAAAEVPALPAPDHSSPLEIGEVKVPVPVLAR